jgi:hypothetical protein
MDRCQTATCARDRIACDALLQRHETENSCSERCNVRSECVFACLRADGGNACRDACDEAMAPGYDACLRRCSGLPDAAQRGCRRACMEKAPCIPSGCM